MHSHTVNTLRALLVIVPSLIAWTPANPVLALQPQSRLWVKGTSTVRSFECKASGLDVRVATRDASTVGDILDGGQAVQSVDVNIPATKLECGNDTMNEHMWKALKTKENPEIAFRLTSYRTTKTSSGLQGEIDGVLSLSGVEKPIVLQGTAQGTTDGALRILGSHVINMREFGIKPPSLMMGTMKVGENVTVNYDLTLKQ
ncbi:MAG: YceI family protein [Gemmatimonadaceae bacterium]